MSKEKRLVPELRFSEFDGEWKHLRLSDVTTRVTRKNKNLETDLPLTISAEYGLVDQSDFFNRYVASKDMSGYYLLKKGEFAYNKSYSNGNPWGVVRRLTKYDQGALSSLYICFNANGGFDPDFIEKYFQSNVWHKEVSMIAVEGARNHGLLNISVNEFFETLHYLPSYNEQKKIATFLSLIDKKIELLEKKVELLEQQKRGLLQKIFSQEIRFKKDDGSEFEEWEDTPFSKIFKERKKYSSKDLDFPHVSLTKEGVVPKTERYERDFLVKSNDKKYKITHLNDICYNPANLKFGVISRNKFGSAIFSPIYVTFEVNKKYNSEFIEYFVTRKDLINKLRRFEEGTVYERTAVKPFDFLTFSFHLPQIEEQRKIADFLSKHDLLIDVARQKLENIKELKRGLLQKMFI